MNSPDPSSPQVQVEPGGRKTVVEVFVPLANCVIDRPLEGGHDPVRQRRERQVGLFGRHSRGHGAF
jgi:hypothetical protein